MQDGPINGVTLWRRIADDIERSIQDAFHWSYAAYYHSAIALTGALVR